MRSLPCCECIGGIRIVGTTCLQFQQQPSPSMSLTSCALPSSSSVQTQCVFRFLPLVLQVLSQSRLRGDGLAFSDCASLACVCCTSTRFEERGPSLASAHNLGWAWCGCTHQLPPSPSKLCTATSMIYISLLNVLSLQLTESSDRSGVILPCTTRACSHPQPTRYTTPIVIIAAP